jgi:hypothetical protein
MTRKTLTTSLVLGLLGGSLWLGISVRHSAAQAAPVKPATPTPNSMADLLSGRLYPNTIKRSALIANYHLVSLIDAQGKPAVCATQGTLLTLGSETFLVAYLLPPPTPAPAADATTPPTTVPAPPADEDAQLTLINMRYVQALGGIHDVPPPTAVPAAPEAPANPATPAVPAVP